MLHIITTTPSHHFMLPCMGVLNLTYMIPYLTQTHINGQAKDPLWSSSGVVKARLRCLVFVALYLNLFNIVLCCIFMYCIVLFVFIGLLQDDHLGSLHLFESIVVLVLPLESCLCAVVVFSLKR